MIQISLLTIILSFGFMQKQKISVMNFARGAALEPLRQAFCEPYGFVPPCSMGALVTLPYVGIVHSFSTSFASTLVSSKQI